MAYTIDRVKVGDEAALAYIQTESWKAAFKDILPPDVLAQSTDIDRATRMYKRLLEQQVGNGYLLRVDGTPHCIAWWDKARDQSFQSYAELICIHSLQAHWHEGYGSQMMNTVLQDIAKAGYDRVMLWVFEENNRARRFYEKHGFSTQGRTKPDSIPTELCYERML